MAYYTKTMAFFTIKWRKILDRLFYGDYYCRYIWHGGHKKGLEISYRSKGKSMTVPTVNAALAISLKLPTIQNWSCHHCTNCCRHHAIEVTAEERRRILSQRWTVKDGLPTGEAVFVRQGGERYRLAHQTDGACVFLDERGLCRIHAKYGEAAKPRACRVYPYAFHPAGKKVAVSLRFSCPSVAANRGLSLGRQRDEIQRLARVVVPDGHERMPAPAVSKGKRVDWLDFMRFITALDETLTPANAPITLKLQRALYWLNLVEKSPTDGLAVNRPGDMLDFMRQAACHCLPEETPPSLSEEVPAAMMKKMFRQLTAQYARKDTVADLSSGWSGRWKLLRAAMRFTRGTGLVPALQTVFREVPFESLEQPFGVPEECEDLWTRYFRVKVQGLHFCGPAFYGWPLVEGFRSLALVFPATMWIARWLAVSQNRTKLSAEDVSQALTISDRHHGYSPIFGSFGFRGRVQTLSRMGEIPKLIRWYAR
ncbi:MAG: YkgJ family cysteine cluster protein [bacterium]|nr:YkgJ family cysteine cluster protein [bacterium]